MPGSLASSFLLSAALLLLFQGVSPVVSSAAVAPPSRPNLIVFFPDTVRAESLSSYDHPFVSTPNTDRLAAEGVLFEQAHAQHTQCSPSRCAVFTGRYMHVLGHRTQNHLLQPTEPNVFAYLKAAGYTTISIGKNDALSAGAFNRTFSYWVNEDGVPQGSNRFAFGEAGYYSFGYNASDEPGNSTSRNKNTDYVAALTVAELLSGGKLPEPFALFLTGIGAHPPTARPSTTIPCIPLHRSLRRRRCVFSLRASRPIWTHLLALPPSETSKNSTILSFASSLPSISAA